MFQDAGYDSPSLFFSSSVLASRQVVVCPSNATSNSERSVLLLGGEEAGLILKATNPRGEEAGLTLQATNQRQEFSRTEVEKEVWGE